MDSLPLYTSYQVEPSEYHHKHLDADSTEIQHIRKILGDKAIELSDEEIKDIGSTIKYLVDCWLTAYERQIFQGKTLQELLAERR